MKIQSIIHKIGIWLCGLSVGAFLLNLPIFFFVKLRSFIVFFSEGWDAAAAFGQGYQYCLWCIMATFIVSVFLMVLARDASEDVTEDNAEAKK